MDRVLTFALVVLLFGCGTAVSHAQRPGNRGQTKPAEMQLPKLPDDPKLKDLHREFIVKAERLAMEYERRQEFTAAQSAYESLLRIAPDHSLAKQALQRVLDAQAQDKRLVRVSASEEWQDTGIKLIKGMPVHILAKGTWTLSHEMGPEGLVIPDEYKLKDNRIKLGSLIGVISPSGNIQDGRPFRIGESKDFTADRGGTLFLRMYDFAPSDNEGTVMVLVRSTFE
ncbi:hypothetical protein UC8_08100 [Roseimaritima ulvae]|uniref:Tetratricopeptide repeat protein n=2 Tax=Roseimaritima ulvae TaxID=980254 RepID=A0A5B9QM09_9BACT|nr:hypothetical protein UC8_08100 [Roseimaritima ulvae]